MDKNNEQRSCLKFCIANGISCAESLKISQKASMSPTKGKIAKVKEMVIENRHLSLREITAELSVSHE